MQPKVLSSHLNRLDRFEASLRETNAGRSPRTQAPDARSASNNLQSAPAKSPRAWYGTVFRCTSPHLCLQACPKPHVQSTPTPQNSAGPARKNAQSDLQALSSDAQLYSTLMVGAGCCTERTGRSRAEVVDATKCTGDHYGQHHASAPGICRSANDGDCVPPIRVLQGSWLEDLECV